MLQSRIWILIGKKLSGEATGTDLSELNRLVSEHPYLVDQLGILMAAWEHNKAGNIEEDNSAFGKLVDKMKKMQQEEVA